MKQQDQIEQSLLSQYQRLLEEGPRDACDSSELEHIQQMPLKELDLDLLVCPGRSETMVSITSSRNKTKKAGERRFAGRLWNLPALGAIAAAAMLTLILYPSAEQSPSIIAKGGIVVTVFAKKDDTVRRLDGATLASDGDLIRAQVTAPQAGSAFWAITDINGSVISDPGRIVSDRLDIEPTKAATFPGSFEIVGQNEGETIVVMFCNRDLGIDIHSVSQIRKIFEGTSPMTGCIKYRQPLRHQ